MGLLSFLFPSLRKPKPFFAPPSKPPAYARGTRVWVAWAQCAATVVDVGPIAGRWRYALDLDSHEDCRSHAFESEISLNETHPHWKDSNHATKT